MSKIRKFTIVMAVILWVSGISGCGDYNEIDDLNVVVGLAIDEVGHHRLRVTCDVMNPVGPQGEEGAAFGNKDFVVSGEGDSVSSALQDIQRKVAKRVYLSHNALVVLSDRVVSSQLASILDELDRNREMRLNQILAVVKGEANRIWDVSPHSSTPLAIEVREAIQQWAKRSNVFATEQFRFLRDINEPYGVGRLVWLNPEDGNLIEGIGLVDRKGRIIWWPIHLPADVGVLWVMGNTHNVLQRVLFVDPETHVRGFVCIHWTTTNTKLEWMNSNHVLTMRIKWRGIGYIEAMTAGHESDQTVYRVIESEVARLVEREILQAIERMRESDVDGLEMRINLYRTSPEMFRRVEHKNPCWWKTCAISFDVRPHIVHGGLATNSPR